MKSSLWVAKNCSVSQEVPPPSNLWNPKIHYRRCQLSALSTNSIHSAPFHLTAGVQKVHGSMNVPSTPRSSNICFLSISRQNFYTWSLLSREWYVPPPIISLFYYYYYYYSIWKWAIQFMNLLISHFLPSFLSLPFTWLIPVSVEARVLSLCIILHHVKILWVLFPLRWKWKPFIAQQSQHFPPQNQPLFRSASVLRSHKRSNMNIVLDSMRESTNTIREVSQSHDRP